MAAEIGNGIASGPQSLTGHDNYFEDFNLGDVYEHARGKTVGEIDNVLITNLVMNTAQGHFNEHLMASNPIGHRITFGGVTASLVIGLAMGLMIHYFEVQPFIATLAGMFLARGLCYVISTDSIGIDDPFWERVASAQIWFGGWFITISVEKHTASNALMRYAAAQ